MDKAKDIFNRIESALGQWTEEVSSAHEGLSARLTRARERIAAESDVLAEPEGVGDADAATHVAALAQALRDWSGAANEAASWSARLHESIQTLSRDIDALRDALRDAAASDGNAALASGGIDDLPRDHVRLAERVSAIEQALNFFPDSPSAIGLAESPLSETKKEEDAIDLTRFVAENGEPAKDAPPPLPELEAYDVDGTRRRLGEILVAAKVISSRELDAALTLQASAPYRHLGELLVEQGVISEELIAHALACQCGLPFMHLEDAALDELAARLISARLASHHNCIPLHADANQLVLAMANPLDLIAIEDVELATGRRVDPVAATPADVRAAIARVFGPSSQ